MKNRKAKYRVYKIWKSHPTGMRKAVVNLIAGDKHTINTLVQYSNAEISSVEAMDSLRLRYHGQLLDLLGRTNLPFPSLPQTQIDLMVGELLALSNDPSGI
ncbi:MAG: hypothetical protein Q7K26_06375 [bacterium]|nr:hypothetical protein [bacterium]